jgi:hypothetical protein
VRWLAAAAAIGTAVLIALHWDDVLHASSAIPVWAFGAAVGLHLATLALRSEAWRIVLSAITGEPLPRVALHGANAGAFLAGVAQSHAALPVRVALLSRMDVGAIRRAQVALADVPIVAVEIACACVLVAVASLALHSWWQVPAALAVGVLALVAVRVVHARFAHRPLAHGLAVLSHTRLRITLACLLALVTLGTVARLWVLLSVTDLPASFASAVLVVVSLGIFGLLPLGPGASPAGTVATLGASGLSSALVLGVAVSATSICAVVLYAGIVGAAVLVLRGRAARARRGRSTCGPGHGR